MHRSALAANYGSGCAGTLSALNRGPRALPFAGSEFFGVRLDGARPSAPTWLLASLGPADLPMPGAAAGRRLLPDGSIAIVEAGSGTSDLGGRLARSFPLPGSVPVANLYWQAVQVDRGLLWLSDGLRTEIR